MARAEMNPWQSAWQRAEVLTESQLQHRRTKVLARLQAARSTTGHVEALRQGLTAH